MIPALDESYFAMEEIDFFEAEREDDGPERVTSYHMIPMVGHSGIRIFSQQIEGLPELSVVFFSDYENSYIHAIATLAQDRLRIYPEDFASTKYDQITRDNASELIINDDTSVKALAVCALVLLFAAEDSIQKSTLFSAPGLWRDKVISQVRYFLNEEITFELAQSMMNALQNMRLDLTSVKIDDDDKLNIERALRQLWTSYTHSSFPLWDLVVSRAHVGQNLALGLPLFSELLICTIRIVEAFQEVVLESEDPVDTCRTMEKKFTSSVQQAMMRVKDILNEQARSLHPGFGQYEAAEFLRHRTNRWEIDYYPIAREVISTYTFVKTKSQNDIIVVHLSKIVIILLMSHPRVAYDDISDPRYAERLATEAKHNPNIITRLNKLRTWNNLTILLPPIRSIFDRDLACAGVVWDE